VISACYGRSGKSARLITPAPSPPARTEPGRNRDAFIANLLSRAEAAVIVLNEAESVVVRDWLDGYPDYTGDSVTG
jgi:hypothetical protein